MKLKLFTFSAVLLFFSCQTETDEPLVVEEDNSINQEEILNLLLEDSETSEGKASIENGTYKIKKAFTDINFVPEGPDWVLWNRDPWNTGYLMDNIGKNTYVIVSPYDRERPWLDFDYHSAKETENGEYIPRSSTYGCNENYLEDCQRGAQITVIDWGGRKLGLLYRLGDDGRTRYYLSQDVNTLNNPFVSPSLSRYGTSGKRLVLLEFMRQ